MDGMLIALATEAISIILIIGSWIWLSWKRRKERQSDVEALLASIEEHQPARFHTMTQRLRQVRKCSESDAEAIVSDLANTEKQLLQTLIGQYLLEQPITNLYNDLYILLDRYFALIDPSSKIEINKTPSTEETEKSKKNQPSIEDEMIGDDPTEKPAEPDWGDVFD